jgi:drug/metabolite transporter (DMT)-like permease
MKRILSSYPGILIAMFTLAWALVEIIGSQTGGVSAYQVVWTRYGVHLAFMALVFGPRHGRDLVRTRRLPSQIFASLLMLGMPLCFIWELERMPVQDASVVFWIAPALIVGMSMIAGKRYGGIGTVIATIVGLAGAILICDPDAGVLRRGAILGVGMAVCFSLYMFVVRSMKGEALLTKLFHTALWVFMALSLGLPYFWKAPTVRGMIAMTAIGLLGWIGLLSLDLAIEAMPVGILAPVLYTQLVWDMLLQWPLREVPLDTRTIIGALLALGASIPALMHRASTTDSEPGAAV